MSADEDDIDGVPLSAPSPVAAPATRGTTPSPAVPSAAVSLPLTSNRLALQRAAVEEKRRRQEEEAAAVYADFLSSFDGQAAGKATAAPAVTRFVSGGLIRGNSAGDAPLQSTSAATPQPKRQRTAEEDSGGASSFTPPLPLPLPTRPLPPPRSSSPLLSASAVSAPAPPAAATTAGAPKRRHIDAFLEELKAGQAQPQPTPASHQSPYSIRELTPLVSDAPPTTNLYIVHLPPDCSPEEVAQAFCPFGDVASAKVLWPRSDEERLRGSVNGFVAFMRRRDAEDALREMNGSVWRGQTLRLNWAKAIGLPHQPMRAKAHGRGAADRTGPAAASAPTAPASSSAVSGRRFVIAPPSSSTRRAAIDQLAWDVSQLGYEWEQALLEREAKERAQRGGGGGGGRGVGGVEDPFDFLFSFDSADNLYYRWRVFSLTHGGSLTHWPVEAFHMTPDGPLWVPPPQPSTSPASALSALPVPDEWPPGDAAALSSLLSAPQLSLERPSILRAMGFCVERSASAAFLVRHLCGRIRSSSVSASVERLALLYVLSDCLYNSSAPVRGASMWRKEVEGGPEVVEALRRWSDRGVGRVERDRVIGVLRAWEAWSLFDVQRIAQWEKAVRPPPPPPITGGQRGGGEAAAESRAAEVAVNGSADGKASSAGTASSLHSTNAADEDVDGVPLAL